MHSHFDADNSACNAAEDHARPSFGDHDRRRFGDPARRRFGDHDRRRFGDPARRTLDDPARSELYRRVYAHDASHFLKYPSEVRVASTLDDIRDVFAEARSGGAHITFRSGGTSLNGQSVTDGILVDTRRGFRGVAPLDGGSRLRVEPGVTIRHANAVLRRSGRIMGPDPASEIAATIGGVIANNASGMSCGTEHNSYRMIDFLSFILASGNQFDTANSREDSRFAALEPSLYQALERYREQIRLSPALKAEVERQFSMKNTMGYGLNSFLDYDRPIDIFSHLLVGSEGTLGFVSEATFHTLPIRGDVATALWVFPSVVRAAEVIPALVDSGASAVELMDSTSLRVAQTFDTIPGSIAALHVTDHAALLVEYQEDSSEALASRVAEATTLCASLGLKASFTSDPQDRAMLWSVRKGLYATVAGARRPGVTALLEDIVVPVPTLARTCSELAQLLSRHGYEDAVIFGHAKDGNLHFMLTGDFEDPAEKTRLATFTEDMVDLVLRNGGSLKAEHGTGIAMAPFVERQYGSELYSIMVGIKRAADPHNILNPGVIIAGDSAGEHLSHFKETPEVDPFFDRCVECGYCEPICPSKDLTLTPRTRIVALREIKAASSRGDNMLATQLQSAYEYAGTETCAVDGLCATSCPLGINTADIVRKQRRDEADQPWTGVWGTAAKAWPAVTQGAGLALSAAKLLPPKAVEGTTRALRAVLGKDKMPLWTPDLPAGGRSREASARRYLTPRRFAAEVRASSGEFGLNVSSASDGSRSGVRASSSEVIPESGQVPSSPVAVYMPSCLNAMFAPGGGGANTLQDDFQYLCERAGVRVLIPRSIESLCCGTPWSSKGMGNGYEDVQARTVAALYASTGGGSLPVVCDNSSCTEGLIKLLKGEGLQVIDGPTFIRDHVLPVLRGRDLKLDAGSLAVVHPTCSSTHLGSTEVVVDIMQSISGKVYVPDAWGCCAFAGDRGMLHPELTESATRAECAEVDSLAQSRAGETKFVSSNRTCEIGMSRGSGRDYLGVISVLAAAVRDAG